MRNSANCMVVDCWRGQSFTALTMDLIRQMNIPSLANTCARGLTADLSTTCSWFRDGFSLSLRGRGAKNDQ